ncbi:MAG TPA: OmpA family protein [Kofleriaceae bacterium]|nr:OmpA family protein [Kofleriaceae bacterium]
MMKTKLLLAISIASLAACGAHHPPQELVDARAAYAHAASSNANQLVPAELHVARNSLDAAERKFDDDGDSQPTKDLAYVALRKAQRAEALGNAAAADQARSQFNAERTKTQEEIIASQRGQLRAAQGQVAEAQQQTAAEHQARIDAEKKAKDSMDALAKSMAVKADERGTVISLPGGVLFATGKAELLPGAQNALNQVADALKAQAEHHFTVEGHTDNQGSAAINDALSAKRANAVRDYLVVHGVAAEAISAQGMGSNRPIADNKTVEGRAMNRRVEIVVDRGAATSPNASASSQ